MADRNSPYLNGAYYGPSIPPPTKHKHRHSHSSPPFSCCCFSLLGSCLRCCCGCIFSLICNILIAIVVILGIATLILWLIFRPNAVKFYVTEANLNRFDLDSSNNLRYDLGLNLTIRNPNQRVGVYYDDFKVDGYYSGQRFGSGEVTPFYQGRKNTSLVLVGITGQSLMVFGDGKDGGFKEEERSGVYGIDLKMRLSVRFKFWVIKSWRFRPKIKCNGLKVPLFVGANSTTNGGVKFESIKCDFDFS